MATTTDQQPQNPPETTEDPQPNRPRATLPMFKQPPKPEENPPATVVLSLPQLESPSGEPSESDRAGTRTGTSSVGSKPKHADVAILVGGCLAVVVLAAAFAVRVRTRGVYELRRPTDRHMHDIASPIARILMRHADLSKLPADLGDIAATGAAVGDYVNDGPLVGPGANFYNQLPDDLQGTDE